MRQQVEDNGGAGPDRLHRLEELIDEAASELGWRPVDKSFLTAEAPIIGGRADEDARHPAEGDKPAHWTKMRRRQR